MDMTGIFLLEKKKELRMLFSSRHCYLEIHLYFLHLLLILLQICDHFISYIRKFFTKYFYIILWTFWMHAVYKFEDNLSSDERAAVHELCRKMGMTSKSKG